MKEGFNISKGNQRP